jgi:hypothetical protein
MQPGEQTDDLEGELLGVSMADCIFDDVQVAGNWGKVASQVYGFANIFGKSGIFA